SVPASLSGSRYRLGTFWRAMSTSSDFVQSVSCRLGPDLEQSLDRLQSFVPLPVLIQNKTKQLVWSSAAAESTCSVAQGEAPCTIEGENANCPHSKCEHHARFAARTIEAGGEQLDVVHCGGGPWVDVVAEHVRAGIESDSDRGVALDELARVYEELNGIYELGTILSGDRETDQILRSALEHSRQLLPIRDAEIWISDVENGKYRCVAALEGEPDERSPVPRTPKSDAGLRKLDLRVFRDEDEFPDSIRVALMCMTERLHRPFLVVPLRTHSGSLGTLLCGLNEGLAGLTAGELKLFSATSRQISVCLQVLVLLDQARATEGLKKEVEIAREIQTALFPQNIPVHPGYDLYGGCVTAARVGGDYYDMSQREDDILDLLIADASGHSVASGLISMSFRSSFRHFLDAGEPIETLFTGVNRALHDELYFSGHFLSAFYATYRTSSRQVRYVNAGHHPPILIRPSEGNRSIVLDESSLLIGVLKEVEYPVGEATLEPGDVFVLYTDGIIEAENQHQEPFGLDRLVDSVRRYAKSSAKLIYHLLLKELYVFQDEQFNKDDVTLVVLKIRDDGSGEAHG
ncbi:MAG: PP2C family protein-serine/threonine phosphatase, partial [Planctomycetota bacterium]